MLKVKEAGAGSRDPLLDLAIGQCFEQISQPERALPYFENALRKSPDQKDAKEARDRVANTVLLKNAYLLQEKGDFLAASNAFLGYLEKNPKDNDMLLQVARLHSWARDNSKAMLYYEAYLVKKPQDITALRELARLQLEIPDFAAARKTLATVLSSQDASPDDYANMINANLWDSRHEEAQPWIAKLKEIAPGHQVAQSGGKAVLGKAQTQQLDRARVLASTGKFSEALQSYRRYIDRYGADREIELAVARLLAWDGQPVKAMQAYREYLNRYKNDAQVRLELADLERWQGKRGSAEREYRAVLEKEPGNNKAMFGLAQIADQRGDDRFSVFNAYRDILDRDPSHKVSRERLGDLSSRVSPSLGYEQMTFHDSDRFNRSMNTIVAGIPLPGGLRISPLLRLGYFSQLRQVGGGECGTGYDPRSREKDPAIRRISEDICATEGHLKGLGGGVRFDVSPNPNVFFSAEFSGFKLDTPTQRVSPMLSAELVLRAAGNKRLTMGVKRRSAAFEVNTIGTLYANILTDTAEASFEVPMNDRWNLWVYGGISRYTRGADPLILSNFQKRITARADYQVTPSTKAGYYVRLSGFRRYSPLYFSPEFYGTTGVNWTWDKPLMKNFRFLGDIEAGYGRIHRYDSPRVNNLELSFYPSFVWDIRQDLSLHIGYRFGRGRSSSFGSPVYSTGTLDMGLTNYFTPSLPPPGMNRIEIR